MNAVVRKNFAVKPVVAALTLAFAAVNAYAITPNQMPGGGRVTNVSPAATVDGGGVGTNVFNLVSGATITLGGAANARAVIQWGGLGAPASPEFLNPQGFNIGASATLNFDNVGGGVASVLNIDASGSSSQILGTLQNNAFGGAGAVSIFLSNANGITVGGNGRIIAPFGVGLLGADLNNATAKHDFVRNSASATSFIDVTGGQSSVTIGPLASINGDAVFNAPAQYVLLAGGDVTNMGNVFGSQVAIAAGMRAAPGTDTVNGVAKTTVNRLWNTEFYGATGSVVNGNLGTVAPNIEVAAAGKHFVNTGSVNAADTFIGFSLFPTYIGVAASGNISSGTAGDKNQNVGLFTDGTLVLDTFGATSKTELYNGVAGWTSPSSLSTVNINQQTKATGDVTVNTITIGSNPSALTTTGPVSITGANVVISSTINHKLKSAGGKQGDDELNIYGTKSVTITADIGAGNDVYIGANGPMTISGNVLADTNEGGAGGIYIYNYGRQSGNTTTISGNLTTAKTSDDDIRVYNYGLANSNVDISGTLTTHDGADVIVYSRGNLKFSGKIDSDGDAHLTALGTNVSLQGPINADLRLSGSDMITFAAPSAMTKVYPAAVLTAPTVKLGYDNFTGEWIGVGGFTGVNASGLPYATAAQKPAAQIVTNSLVAQLFGSMNAPIAGNTNWLNNQMQVAALDPTLPILASISAVGAGFQAINLGFTGNLIVDSGATATPFSGIGLTTGFFPAGGLIGNGGSQLILNASGSMDIVANSGAQGGSGPGFNGLGFFEFPGGVVFKSGEALTQFVPVYNAWTTVAQAYQGIFFESPSIFALSYLATNGNSWGNWSTKPAAGASTIYQIAQDPPTGVANRFGFIPSMDAAHQNVYSDLILGGVNNTCPVNTCGWTP